MPVAAIDFESFYDENTSIVTMGTDNYVAATDAYMVSTVVDGDCRCGTIAEMGDYCEQLAKDPTVIPMAANANFDRAWWAKYWPQFENEWHCLLDHAAFHQLPRSLAPLAECLLGKGKVDKTVRSNMKGVHYEALSETEKQTVLEYCLNDSIREQECFEALPLMSETEEKIALLTRIQNRRGVRINTDLVRTDKTALEEMKFDSFKRIPWHTDAKPLSHSALVKWCGLNGIPAPTSTAKTDEECCDLMSDHPALAEVLGQLRRYRRSNTLLKKVNSLLSRVTPDDKLPLDLMYCGAPHTRRWSARGFNIHNLEREPLDLGTGKTIWSRNWIIPRPGTKFLVLDYSQIEPRVLNWLVGNEEMLATMRQGFSIYEAFAKSAEHWTGAPGTLKKEWGKAKYTLLKNRVLGLGYGMGATGFQNYVRVNGGGELSMDESTRIVNSFRAQNKRVVGMWNTLDGAVTAAVASPDKKLVLKVPSGDVLIHWHVGRLKRGYESYTTKGDFSFQSHQDRLWGGTLTENVTQRVARDVLADACIRLEDAGFPVLFTVHDEVILEVDADAGEEAQHEAEQIMRTPPAWGTGIPLDVEGGFADSYTK